MRTMSEVKRDRSNSKPVVVEGRMCPTCKTTNPKAFSGRAKNLSAPCKVCARDTEANRHQRVIHNQKMVDRYFKPCKPWIKKELERMEGIKEAEEARRMAG